MYKNKNRTLIGGIASFFAILALAVVFGMPATTFAVDEGWHDPAGWFNESGSIENESDWYSATYGYGEGMTTHDMDEVRSYYQEQEPTSGYYATDRQSQYGGYGPVSPGFGKLYEGRPYGVDEPYTYYNYEGEPRYYYEESRRSDDVFTEDEDFDMAREREHPYGTGYGWKTPGFEKFQPGMGLGYQPYGYYEQRGLAYDDPWTSNLYGHMEEEGEAFSTEERSDDAPYGYYEGSMMDERNYYTPDWERRGGNFESW